jgi:hypothetical protein
MNSMLLSGIISPITDLPSAITGVADRNYHAVTPYTRPPGKIFPTIGNPPFLLQPHYMTYPWYRWLNLAILLITSQKAYVAGILTHICCPSWLSSLLLRHYDPLDHSALL